MINSTSYNSTPSRTQDELYNKITQGREAGEPNLKSVWWAHGWDKALVPSRWALGTYCLLWSSSEGSRFCQEISWGELGGSRLFEVVRHRGVSVWAGVRVCCKNPLFLKGFNQSWAPADLLCFYLLSVLGYGQLVGVWT